MIQRPRQHHSLVLLPFKRLAGLQRAGRCRQPGWSISLLLWNPVSETQTLSWLLRYTIHQTDISSPKLSGGGGRLPHVHLLQPAAECSVEDAEGGGATDTVMTLFSVYNRAIAAIWSNLFKSLTTTTTHRSLSDSTEKHLISYTNYLNKF